MAELLRQTNGLLDDSSRDLLVAKMGTSLGHSTANKDQPTLSPAERRAMMDRYGDCNRRVARRWFGAEELFPDTAPIMDDDWEPVSIDREQMLKFFDGMTLPVGQT